MNSAPHGAALVCNVQRRLEGLEQCVLVLKQEVRGPEKRSLRARW